VTPVVIGTRGYEGKIVRWGWRVLLGLALCCAPGADAWAQKRVALVIGNSVYQHAAHLPNPVNDASAVAKLIKDIGFEVVDLRRDLVATDLRRAIREFAQQARGADIAIVYYAGHGIELNGTNYLVPTDGRLEQDFDVEDETVPLERLLAAVEPAKRLRLLILDACRDNPFVKRMKRTVATRAIGQGLAKVEPTSSDTLIAFAAKAGSIANDGEGPHSPFTAALLKHLPSPAVDVRLVFGRVRDFLPAREGSRNRSSMVRSVGPMFRSYGRPWRQRPLLPSTSGTTTNWPSGWERCRRGMPSSRATPPASMPTWRASSAASCCRRKRCGHRWMSSREKPMRKSAGSARR
jgi:caspase domain-containing protein